MEIVLVIKISLFFGAPAFAVLKSTSGTVYSAPPNQIFMSH